MPRLLPMRVRDWFNNKRIALNKRTYYRANLYLIDRVNYSSLEIDPNLICEMEN